MNRADIRAEEEKEYENKVHTLFKLYKDPTSKLFLDSSTQRIYEAAKKDARLLPIDRKDIIRYKLSLESLSRNRQRRYIGSKKRHDSYRSWIVHGPKNILCGRFFSVNGELWWS